MGDDITTLGGGESAPAAEPTAPTAAPSWTEQLPKGDLRSLAGEYEDAPAFAKAFLSKSGAGWEEIDGDPQPWTEQLPKHLRKLKALNSFENLPALAEAFSGLNGEQDPGPGESEPEKDGKADPEKPPKRLKGERALFKQLAEIDFKNDPSEVIAAEMDRLNSFIDSARGVPDSPEGYEVPEEVTDYFASMGRELPEELAGDEGRWLAKELGLTKDQYAGLMEALAFKGEIHKQQYEAAQLEQATFKRELGKLKTELGDRFEGTVQFTEQFLQQTMPPPLFKAMHDRSFFGDVNFMKWAMGLASQFMEDQIVAGSGPQERGAPSQQQAATAEQRKYEQVYGRSMG